MVYIIQTETSNSNFQLNYSSSFADENVGKLEIFLMQAFYVLYKECTSSH